MIFSLFARRPLDSCCMRREGKAEEEVCIKLWRRIKIYPVSAAAYIRMTQEREEEIRIKFMAGFREFPVQ